MADEESASRRPTRPGNHGNLEDVNGARTVVMADVALRAGVSQMTVSRVLNNTSGVAEATRRRVLDAVTELDYRPHAAARALASGRSRVLGVVAFNTTLFGPASTLAAIQEAAYDAEYSVSVASLRELDGASIDGTVRRLRDQGVDGLIVMTPHPTAINALAVIPDELPAVSVLAGSDDRIPAVTIDQFDGARLATQHLLELGHKTVHHVAGPHDWVEAGKRVRGWRETLGAAAAPVPPVLVGDWSARSGYELGRQLLAGGEVTAVFVGNDPMALGLYRAVREEGRSIPDDISIVGFDDVPEAAYYPPPLTTVRQEFDQVGRRSLEVLLERIDGGPGSGSVEIPAELVNRESTAPTG